MSKLYIPTSTRNFTNILSSESISPKVFYELRGFGIPYWLGIRENALDNAIILYNRPFVFNRPKSDTEDHPMFVEIDTDERFQEVCNGVYLCEHTIYLSPFNTRFIFFTEEDRRTMISLSDNMSEVKLASLYNERFVVEKYTNSIVDTDAVYDAELNKKEIERDKRINKMKGLLYGYYIGAMFSTSESFIRKYNILSGLQDIYYAIISSVDHKPTTSQKEEMEYLIWDLYKTKSYYSILQQLERDDDKIFNAIKDLTTVGVIFPDFSFPKEIIESISTNTDYTKNWLKSEMDKLNEDIVRNRSLLNVSDKDVIIKDLSLSTLSCISDVQEKDIVKTWVNNVFVDMYDDSISSDDKKELSDKVTQQAKVILGDRWENSPIRYLLNEMRRFVREQDNNLQWNNYIVSSVTAVIEKGDDWENLLSFMKRKSMYDYRLAFALYGELHGYANLTRDFTDKLYDISDKKYIADVYKEFYRQLFGKDVYVEKVSITDKDNTSSTTNNLKKKVEVIIESHPRIKIPPKELDIILQTAETAQNSSVFIKSIAPQVNTKSGIFLHLQKELYPDYKSHKKRKKASKESNLFAFPDVETEENGSNAYDNGMLKKKIPLCLAFDAAAWSHIEGIVPASYREDIKNDFGWFISEMRKEPALRKEYYRNVDRNNNSYVIDKFCNLKKGKIDYFPDDLREKVRILLKSIYI